MANEISLSVNLIASKGGAAVSGTVSQVSTMAGDQMATNVQSIGSTTETILLGDITTLGYVFFKNMDAAITITLSTVTPASTTPFAVLLPGDVCIIKGTSATLYAISASGTPNLLVTAVEL